MVNGKRRRTQYRRRFIRPKKAEESAESIPSTPWEGGEDEYPVSTASNGFSTPKAQRHRIPEPLSCPPAPKKKRIALHCSSDKPPISFFNPPELETFFFFASHNISV